MHADPNRLMRQARFYIWNKLFIQARRENNAMLDKKLKQTFIYCLDYLEKLKYRQAKTAVVCDIIICQGLWVPTHVASQNSLCVRRSQLLVQKEWYSLDGTFLNAVKRQKSK